MRMTAIAFWALSILSLLTTLYFTPTKAESGPVGGPMQTTYFSLFEGMNVIGGIIFFSIFAFFVAGCVFWVGNLLKRPA